MGLLLLGCGQWGGEGTELPGLRLGGTPSLYGPSPVLATPPLW